MIHLHARSRYSLLEAVPDIDDLIRLAKESGQSAVVLCDHRSMFATMAFLHAAKQADLKPIIGLEFEVLYLERPYSLILLARNGTGLQNLFALSTRLMSGEAAIPLEDLHQYTPHTILMTAGGDENLGAFCTPGYEEEVDVFLQTLADQAADLDSFYVSMSLHDSPLFRRRDEILKERAKALGLKTVALSRIEYEKPEEERTLRLLQAIGQQKTIEHPDLPVRSGRYWRSKEEMALLYDEDDLKRTDEIAEKIEDYSIEKASLPKFQNRYGMSSEDWLTSLCQAGLKKRLQGRRVPEYEARLKHELDVILSMGFADYFLIVWDFIREARSRGILVGPGRGSAAGSLVAWVLGIAHVDPVASGLLFERFLNPERISMPDIDTDFPDNRRDEMIEYVQSVYGRNHVAHIVTFSRLKAKAALRDAARALGMPMRDAEKLTALVPSAPGTTLEGTYASSRAFASLVENTASLRRLYQAARSIENFPRHTSIHAGGIVLAGEDITEQAPLWDAGGTVPAVQFSMDYLEEIGLIKFDFLALRNLTMIADMCALIKEQGGPDLDLLHLPLNDRGVYEMLTRGDTLGVFQLESAGIRRLIMRFRPARFEDIAAILALYRPGPMKSIDTYLSARFHPESRQSIHPLLDGLLAETGGIFLYQEQIMEAARIIGGFSLAQADILRKAMSKKKRDVMEAWKARFVEGAAARNIPAPQAEHIFSIMEQFADYGFNKSHSYAYGLVVYQMAWIKVHFPYAFYQTLLTFSGGSGSKTAAILQEASRRRVRVLPILLNRSTHVYIREPEGLRMPLTLVRTFGKNAVEKIMQERDDYGPFDDPIITILRLARLKFSSDQILSLIRVGALDESDISRESLEAGFEEIIRLIDLAILDEETHRWRLAGVSAPEIPFVKPDPARRLLHEKEILGFTLSAHPARAVRQSDHTLLSIERVQSRSGPVSMAGIISKVRLHKTKKGDQMAFATLQDDTGEIELAIMPRTYEQSIRFLKEGAFVRAEGKKDNDRSVAIFTLRPLRF